MNNIMQMIMGNMVKQVPQKMMTQLTQQLKRVNPQAYKEFQEARQNNVNPQEYLNQITNGFTPEQRQQWESMVGNYQQNNGIK